MNGTLSGWPKTRFAALKRGTHLLGHAGQGVAGRPVASGGWLEVYSYSALVLDDALATGTIRLLSYANAGSRFDDVRVMVEGEP